MQATFLFYDLETSGLNPAFDQIIQFAAIRTDKELNELERYEWLVRPNHHIIPSPMAMMTHRTPIKTWLKGEPELTVVKRIHELFNTPGTISLGYNSLGFDDEFLRFNFYRNLLSPYTHQYAHFCSRADLYPMATLFYLFHPSLLKWPMYQDRVSLKLDALNLENGLATGAAHNAIVDIEATIALAKIFMREAATWHYALGYFDKAKDVERQAKLPRLFDKKQALLVDGSLGALQHFCAPILCLGEHHHYKNQSCWLRLDTENLALATSDDFIQHSWVINKKFAEPGFLLPPSEKYLSKLNDEKRHLFFNNISWLDKNRQVLERIEKHYRDATYPKYPHVAPEASLYYQGFWNEEQQRQMQQFHLASVEKKSSVIDRLSDPLLKILAMQALSNLDIQLLSQEQRDILEENRSYAESYPEKIIDYKGKQKLTAAQALNEIQELKNGGKLDDEQAQLLDDLREFILCQAKK